ncbi:MAG: NAD(P)-dependent oxidoreductase [Gracilibacteraceae bacterium]|nr:NAD(P)-dependent oxidoreductase [Gracilibacteraceae bacterium]
MKILLTGGAGRLGKWVARELLAGGHTVTITDRVSPAPELLTDCSFIEADLTDLEQTRAAVAAAAPDAVIQLAAVAVPTERTYRVNTRCDWQIMQAAAEFQVKKIILAGSEASYGFAFAKIPLRPQYLPVDEEHPQLPQDSYGCSKVSAENFARAFCLVYPWLQITCLRLGLQLEPRDLSRFADAALSDADLNRLFGYCDMRDAAGAFRSAAERGLPGFTVLNITGADTYSRIPSNEITAKYFPGTEVRTPLPGFTALVCADRAKKLLGWEAKHSWRNH